MCQLYSGDITIVPSSMDIVARVAFAAFDVNIKMEKHGLSEPTCNCL